MTAVWTALIMMVAGAGVVRYGMCNPSGNSDIAMFGFLMIVVGVAIGIGASVVAIFS